MESQNGSKNKKYVPGSDARPEEIFNFPYLAEDESVQFVADHGRIMFIVRGLPGTGKSTLSSMIRDLNPSAVVCSADSYFNQAFVSKIRNKETLKLSHNFCQERVRKECEQGTHPIIVQNTFVQKWEINTYLEFAAKYKYTVVMAITARKFITDPKVLERTNKKGLNQKYLRSRVRHWEEYIPLYLGWFLGPKDESFVFQQAKLALKGLLGDGKFCRVLNAFSKDEIWKYFNTLSRLFCVATFCNHGRDEAYSQFYLSDEVQNVYGKCFAISILGFVVTRDSVLAVVALTDQMKKLVFQAKGVNRRRESLSSRMAGLSINESSLKVGTSTFTEEFSNEGKSAKLEDLSGELMNTSSMSFIVIASASKTTTIETNVQQYAQKIFADTANEEGTIEDQVFSELDDGTRCCRLPDDSWLVPLEKKIAVSAIFTGLYM